MVSICSSGQGYDPLRTSRFICLAYFFFIVFSSFRFTWRQDVQSLVGSWTLTLPLVFTKPLHVTQFHYLPVPGRDQSCEPWCSKSFPGINLDQDSMNLLSFIPGSKPPPTHCRCGTVNLLQYWCNIFWNWVALAGPQSCIVFIYNYSQVPWALHH